MVGKNGNKTKNKIIFYMLLCERVKRKMTDESACDKIDTRDNYPSPYICSLFQRREKHSSFVQWNGYVRAARHSSYSPFTRWVLGNLLEMQDKNLRKAVAYIGE